MDDEEQFENADEYRDIMLNNKMNDRRQLIKTICLFVVFSIIIIGVILIVFLSTSGDSNTDNSDSTPDIEPTPEEYGNFGQINCTYKVSDINNPIKIINNKFIQKERLTIIIDNNIIPFTSSYKFNTKGNHSVTYIINYKNIDMNYIFKDILSLISVVMVSENSIIINNIENAFENCQNLLSFGIRGFNIDKIKSFKKLFYNTPKLSEINFNRLNTSNVEDFSYMFANSNFRSINNLNLNTMNAKNMSYMFCNCSKLININLAKFNTKNVIDMSYMFQNDNLIKILDFSNFKTTNLRNMLTLKMLEICLIYLMVVIH